MVTNTAHDTADATHRTAHQITIAAPAERVYSLLADVEKWPQMFGPTIHAEQIEEDGPTERIRIWATANGAVRTWTSRRHRYPAAMSIDFRQERSQAPVGGMGGTWAVEPGAGGTCHVRLLHDYFAASGQAADVGWIAKAVDRNSTAELQALKSTAEAGGEHSLVTFADAVEVDGAAEDVYDFLNEAQRWKERLPHVQRVSLEEETPGFQVLEMDTRAKDGSVHETRSVRVCQPHRRIIYKQIVLPALLALHTGRWLIEQRGPGQLLVTSEHTVRIDGSRIADVLGPDAEVAAAQAFVRGALSGNSLATLRLAKRYAEDARGGPGRA